MAPLVPWIRQYGYEILNFVSPLLCQSDTPLLTHSWTVDTVAQEDEGLVQLTGGWYVCMLYRVSNCPLVRTMNDRITYS